jgi:hypothetical protein
MTMNLDLARRAAYSLVVGESASTHAVFLCVSLPHISSMRWRGRSNRRRSPRSCTCAPARRPSRAGPSHTERAPLHTSRFWTPPQDHTSLGLYVHPSLGLVQTLPSRRGSRAPRDWALREVREGRRFPPPPPVMSHAWIRIRITTTGTTVHNCLVFLAPLPILWILVLGRGTLRLPRSRRRGSCLVSFPSSAFTPFFLSASGPATRPASPSIYGIDFSCYFSEMAGTRP